MNSERWSTDEELIAARLRFSDTIPGYETPVAYALARVDEGRLTFGHINDVGGLHRLPAAVLASVCGYVAKTGSLAMTQEQVRSAIELLAPAEAATHHEHPNLWSWRRLLDEAEPDSSFLALFVRDQSDPVADADDELFRTMLTY